MRRDHFTLNIDETSAVAPPTLVLSYDGPDESLADRLPEDDENVFEDVVEASFRNQPTDREVLDEDDDVDQGQETSESGVLSLSHRLTGEYILEAPADMEDIRSLVEAAQAEGGSYRIRIERPEREAVVFVTEALLVYDTDGNLLRTDSLIPSGVEL